MATREQLESALRNAHSAGDGVAARKLALAIKSGDFESPTPKQNPTKTVIEKESFSIPEILKQETLTQKIMSGLAEPITASAGNIAGTSGAGLSSAPALLSGDTKEAKEIAESVSGKFAEATQPKTESGKAVMETIGDLAQYGGELANIPMSYVGGFADYLSTLDPESAKKTIGEIQDQGFFNVLGDKVYEETGSDILQSLARSTPEIIGSIVPLKGVRSKRVENNRELIRRIESEDPSTELAKLEVSQLPTEQVRAELELPRVGPLKPEQSQKILNLVEKSKTVKTNQSAVNTIKQGFDEGVIRAINTSIPKNREKLTEMVNILEKGRNDKKYQVKNRPADVVGDSLAERIKFLKVKNKKSGADVEKEAQSLKGKPVDFGTPTNSFISKLSDEGVTFGENMQPNFVGSTFDGAKGAEDIITKALKRMEKSGTLDAYDIHRFKKTIDEWVFQGKRSEGGLSGRAERIIKGFRSDLDSALDNTYPAYDKANTEFSQTIGPINQINDALKVKVPIDSPYYVSAVGQELRKTMSNYKSRNELFEGIESISDAVDKMGGNFSDDILLQALFANELDAVFGPVARTSLAGNVGQEIKRGARALRSPEDASADAAASLIDKARGINEKNAIKYIKEFLNQNQNK